MKQFTIILLTVFALSMFVGCAKNADTSKIEVGGSVGYEYKTNL